MTEIKTRYWISYRRSKIKVYCIHGRYPVICNYLLINIVIIKYLLFVTGIEMSRITKLE